VRFFLFALLVVIPVLYDTRLIARGQGAVLLVNMALFGQREKWSGKLLRQETKMEDLITIIRAESSNAASTRGGKGVQRRRKEREGSLYERKTKFHCGEIDRRGKINQQA